MASRRGLLFEIRGKDTLTPIANAAGESLTRLGALATRALGALGSAGVAAAARMSAVSFAALAAYQAFNDARDAGQQLVKQLREQAAAMDVTTDRLAEATFIARRFGLELADVNAELAAGGTFDARLGERGRAELDAFLSDVQAISEHQVRIEVDEARLQGAVDAINAKFASITNPLGEWWADFRADVAEVALDQLTPDVSPPDRRPNPGVTRTRDGIIERWVVTDPGGPRRAPRGEWVYVGRAVERPEAGGVGVAGSQAAFQQAIADVAGLLDTSATAAAATVQSLVTLDGITFDNVAAQIASVAAALDVTVQTAAKIYPILFPDVEPTLNPAAQRSRFGETYDLAAAGGAAALTPEAIAAALREAILDDNALRIQRENLAAAFRSGRGGPGEPGSVVHTLVDAVAELRELRLSWNTDEFSESQRRAGGFDR